MNLNKLIIFFGLVSILLAIFNYLVLSSFTDLTLEELNNFDIDCDTDGCNITTPLSVLMAEFEDDIISYTILTYMSLIFSTLIVVIVALILLKILPGGG